MGTLFHAAIWSSWKNINKKDSLIIDQWVWQTQSPLYRAKYEHCLMYRGFRFAPAPWNEAIV